MQPTRRQRQRRAADAWSLAGLPKIMNKFFRDNVAGVLALSVLGSLIAAGIARFIPAPSANGASWFQVVSRPIPVWVLFPYSFLLVLSFALWVLRARRGDLNEIARLQGERDIIHRQLIGKSTECESLQQALAITRSSAVSREDLMRLVAVVLTSAPRSGPDSITDEFVCKRVAGLAGQGVPHAAIGGALGSMLDIGAVARDYHGLLLVGDWKDKMRAAGIPSKFQTTG
jgi:hypothetical protein